MRTLYEVLGLRPAARADEIKAAFRKLAKAYHPDLRPADKRAEARFKEVNEAHAILSDADARARYDASLSQERSLRRQRARKAAATMAASFALTVTMILTAMVWRQQGDGLSLFAAGGQWTRPPTTVGPRGLEQTAPVEGQPVVALARTNGTAETASALAGSPVDGVLVGSPHPNPRQGTPIQQGSGSKDRVEDPDGPVAEQGPWSAHIGLSLPNGEGTEMTFEIEAPAAEDREAKTNAGTARPVRTDAANWVSYRNAPFGFTVKYPADIFAPEAAQSDEHVKQFRSRDGRAALRIFGTPNLAGRTLVQYRTALIQERYGKASLHYAPQRNTWFVLSGFSGDDIFYERVTFACDRRSLHGWTLVFPASERLLYDPITEEMHRNYRHSNGPKALCGTAKAQVSRETVSSGGAIGGPP